MNGFMFHLASQFINLKVFSNPKWQPKRSGLGGASDAPIVKYQAITTLPFSRVCPEPQWPGLEIVPWPAQCAAQRDG
jgi:hypothetical protein